MGRPRPRGLSIALVGLAALVSASLPASSRAADDAETAFELNVRPVLAGTCFPCHGGKKVSGGLRVDSRAALLQGGDSGPALVPGDPDASLIVRAVRHVDRELTMPPGRTLAEGEVAGLAGWVKAGAPWPSGTGRSARFEARRHWAFEPLNPAKPAEDPEGWASTAIDRFIAERWRAEGLRPVPPADRRTLIRRLTFDLVGLPPTPEETAAFLDDRSPDAYERVVDRLLASPRYGERWGRHWLDLARYADTAGDNADYPVPELARYRDYVIAAFNADKPFDTFVREQIAGDLIAAEGPADQYAEGVVATGFLALARRYATAPYELWHLTLEDAIDTTGRALLGLTLRCARCHDHKFDPVSQNDYYALYGVFASTAFPYAGSEEFQSMNRPREKFVPLSPPKEAAPKLAAYRARLADLESRLEAAETEAARSKANDDLLARLRAELALAKRPGLPDGLPGAYAVSEGPPVDAALQRGGDPGKPGPVVPRGAPGFLQGSGCPPPKVAPGASGRRELAEWLTRPDHPLTARVLVNRVWQHHFGRGIVATPSNFGLRGEPPTHPALLDWLTDRFIRDGWSIKALHRRILTSKTYQLSSRHDEQDARKDPDNRLLWRHGRERLDAESLRDAMLAVSGGLETTRPDAHPFPAIKDWHWTQHNAFKDLYASNRRTVYLMTQRLQRHPYLALFDGPDANTSTDVRTRAIVPSQALYLMNDPFVRDRAREFAARLSAASEDVVGWIEQAAALAWNRPPTDDERTRFRSYLQAHAAGSTRAGATAEEAAREARASLARVILTSNEFLYVD